MKLLSAIFEKCSSDSCFENYSTNPEGALGHGVVPENVQRKTWGIERQADMNQVTPEGWIKDTGENVQSQTFWEL